MNIFNMKKFTELSLTKFFNKVLLLIQKPKLKTFKNSGDKTNFVFQKT